MTCHSSFVPSFFFFKQKTAYEMRISDWSSDVCSSDLFKAVWRSWPGTILLYGAIVLHPLLALSNWVRRGHYRGIPWQGWTQLLLGLCVPPLIAEHALGTRAAHAVLGLNDSYAYVLIVDRKSTRLNSSH